jgi:fimbrial chaperone protein
MPSESPAKLASRPPSGRLAEDGAVVFTNPLADDSCRPWTALEARTLELGPMARRRFRFEVAVPEDAAAQECRFAIMFEGEPEPSARWPCRWPGGSASSFTSQSGMRRPQLELRAATAVDHEAEILPALTVENTGSAHTRLEGFVSGRDGAGREIVFMPQSAPVLPGQTRTLALYPQSPEGEAPPEISFPIRLTGRLDWSGQRLDIDEVFAGE